MGEEGIRKVGEEGIRKVGEGTKAGGLERRVPFGTSS